MFWRAQRSSPYLFRRPLRQIACVAVLILSFCRLITAAEPRTPPPAPDLANVSYGSHPRNVLDLWKAKSGQPTPFVVYIHGGGFRNGSKDTVYRGMLTGLLARGISVIAVNYRFSPEVHFPAHYHDCARAIQFARLHAKEWNLDPRRVGATGGSAGGGTSLWLGFHDDLADPSNPDPVLRQSSRLTCIAGRGAQSSYDPRDSVKWIGVAFAVAFERRMAFFGLAPAESDTPKAHQLYVAASPINFVTADDPPVIAFYSEPRGPLPANPKPSDGAHHINFGYKLKERMDALGLECTIRHEDEGADPDRESVEFFLRHLKR